VFLTIISAESNDPKVERLIEAVAESMYSAIAAFVDLDARKRLTYDATHVSEDVRRAQDTPSRGFIDDKNEIKGIDPVGFDLVTIEQEIVRSYDKNRVEKANSDAPVFVTPTRTPKK
jgi:putative heme iron utilization protein